MEEARGLPFSQGSPFKFILASSKCEEALIRNSALVQAASWRSLSLLQEKLGKEVQEEAGYFCFRVPARPIRAALLSALRALQSLRPALCDGRDVPCPGLGAVLCDRWGVPLLGTVAALCHGRDVPLSGTGQGRQPLPVGLNSSFRISDGCIAVTALAGIGANEGSEIDVCILVFMILIF